MTFRAVVLGLVGTAIIAAFQVVSRVRQQTVMLPFASVFTLFTGSVFLLFLLALWNLLARRFFPKQVFQPAELAVVYGLTTVGAAIAGYDEAQFLIPCYIFPFRETQNDNAGPFRYAIPPWMVPQDKHTVEAYFTGHESFWLGGFWRAWVLPLTLWMLWLGVTGAVMWAWTVILRRRWVEHDRLAFPCVQLPLEMCRSGGFGGLAAGKLFWLGFGLSALIESVSQASNWFPNLPPVVLWLDATTFLETLPSPWKALAPMSLTWGTLHAGICYLIPTEILFSSWFFYVLRKLSEVVGYSMGWRELGWDAKGFPFTRSQSTGAWTALFFLLVWAERKRLLDVFDAALSWKKPAEEDPFGSYRWAGRVLLVGTVFLMWWSVQSGMTWFLAIAYYAFYWILTVTMTRIYAQVGPPILELYFIDPQKALTTLFGSLGQPTESLTQFSLLYWINRDHRGQPMAHQLAAFYVGGHTEMERKRTFGALVVLAFFVGALACLLTHLHWAYRVGMDTFNSGGPGESGAMTVIARVREWVFQPKGPQWVEIGFMTFGAAFTLFLAKLSTLAMGSPFHPIGYALAMCFAVEYNWPVFFGCWLLKLFLLRYGGLRLYVRLIPAALGMTLGGFIVPVLWGFLAYLGEWYQ